MLKKENLTTRQPVVVLVGHIDHGKSSILSRIRDFKITEKEAGGITQHIGAYEIAMPALPRRQAGGRQEEEGKKITFIDTPGHEAFTAMRSRGAKVADIAILVVAADAGVQSQTEEAVKHIRKAEIPMIVALNKMDKSAVDPEKAKRELADLGVKLEEQGGEVPAVETSAVTGEGIEDLLEMILLVAQMRDLKADLEAPPQGVIIESYLDSKRGPIATLLLKEGTLETGQIVGTFSTLGKIKRLEDFQGNQIEQGSPGQPLVVLGFNEVPGIGQKFKVFSGLDQARDYLKPESELEIELPQVVEGKGEEIVNLILKVDVKGSLEPLLKALRELPRDKIQLQILRAKVGEVGANDIELAQTTGADIIGFRVGIEDQVQRMAEQRGIKVFNFDLIYDVVESVRKSMKSALKPKIIKKKLGRLEVWVIFKTSGKRQIVGGKITKGEARKGCSIAVFREGEKIGKGKLLNLQKENKDFDRLVKGDEAGILYEGTAKIQEDDILVFYQKLSQEREL